MKRNRHVVLIFALVLAVLTGTLALPAAGPAQAAPAVCTEINPYSILSATTPPITLKNTHFIDADPVTFDASYVDLAGLQITTITPADNDPDPDDLVFNIPTGGLNAGSYTIRVFDTNNAVMCRTTLTVVDFSVPPVPGLTNTPQPTAFARPLIVIDSYGASSTRLFAGQNFDWELNIRNSGDIAARNVVIIFEPGDFVPRETGGLQSVGAMGPGAGAKLIQGFTATSDLAGKTFATLIVNIEYTDVYGTAYTGKFTLTYPAGYPPCTANCSSGPTRTPTPSARPQLVIVGYETTPEVLQPGTQFSLKLDVQNLGTSSAKTVSMIVGGGSSATTGGDGTQTAPGGVSGGSGEFTNFAPLGSSNVQFLGDVASGQNASISQSLIVNVSTNPGAYPFKVSFVYSDDKAKPYTDDQVITLLVRYVPQMEVSFYRDPNPIFVGQSNFLPIQIVNLGKKDVTLGKMEVTGPGTFNNASTTVGPLTPGGYFTLDAEFIPDQPGPVELTVTTNYIDEFNANHSITQTLMVDVQEGFFPEPGEGNADGGSFEPLLPPEETFFDALIRFFKGLLGLGSERQLPAGGEFPVEGVPFESGEGGDGGGQGEPVPAPRPPKG